ncbi:hypothetical protein Tsubulata_008231 [Turnera subulata]|uniref:Pentacotripeptide-repeat region of PRORP domain-containing protein n=1 Tax=Turnera subulata TaxID=218843 RepID=A0A9Q0JLZ5_9ROSI|nr:hypothetical protein Tsubulata_008231 [Turnera subulata]
MSLKAIATTVISTPPRTRDFFLHLLNRATTLSQLAQIHAQLIHHRLLQAPHIAAATKLTHRLFDFRATLRARSLFFSVPEPDLFLFNVLLQGFSDNREPLSAISLFTQMRRGRGSGGLVPDYYTYAFVISAAASLGDEKIGLVLLGKAVVDGFGADLFVGSALVDLCFKISREEYALKVFGRLPERDTVLCNTMISGLMRNSRFEDSIGVFRDMVSGNGPRFDSTTVIAVLPAVAELQDLILGMEIQCLAMKFGCHSHISLLTGLISLYSKCGDAETAWLLFRGIGRRDLISCNAMISGFTLNGKTASSVGLFRELLSSGEKVGPLVFITNGSIRTQSKEKIEAKSTDHMTTIVGVLFCLPIRPFRNG